MDIVILLIPIAIILAGFCHLGILLECEQWSI